MDAHRSPAARLRRRVRTHRRLLAALSAGACVALTLHVVRPPHPASTRVVIARHDLLAGSSARDDDLRAASVPLSLVPGGAVRHVRSMRGRVLASPVHSGEILTDARLVGPGLLAGYPSGTALSTIRLADAASLTGVRIGDRVGVIAADPSARTSPQVVTRQAAVVALPRRDDRDEQGAVLTLAVTSSAALALAGAAVSARLSLLPVG